MRELGPDGWASEEFGQARFKDHRWRRRVVCMAARVARRPAGRVTEAIVDAAERQGAYGFLESESVEQEALGQAMYEACARRSAGQRFVFCAVDGTSLSLEDATKAKGFGPIGNRSKRGRGLKVMNAMVLSPEGIPLGMSSQQWWTRPERRRRKHRDQLRPDQKETRHWLAAVDQTRQVMAAHAQGVKCWFQLDREADAWPILTDAGAGDHWFTVRASRNRRVVAGNGRRTKLQKVLERSPTITEYDLEVVGTFKRKARTAHMIVRACALELDIRDKRTSRRFRWKTKVVQAVERGTTPRGEKPIVWTLLTNHPIETKKDLTDVVLGYSMRWRIEELHRTWKSGACRVEDTQLRSPSAVIKWATMLTAVAVRIERIKRLARDQPNRPATDEFTLVEIQAARLLHFGKPAKKVASPEPVPTLAEVTLWIARLGGYTGQSSSGGPPGSTTLARGLRDVLLAARTIEALDL